jgi:cation diffusion facilitator family transporter
MSINAVPARSYTLLSIAAAILTIALKFGAYWLTDSVGLLSDSMESGINLLAALVAFWALTLAAKPPDEEHMYGYSKAEYFSSGLESALILVAAISIMIAAGGRLLHPLPLEQIGLGLILVLIASAINGGVAWVLLRAGQRLHSITLRADAHHLLTDVWTSAGVVVGIMLVKLTGWLVIDPLIAIAVAFNIIWTGLRLLRETTAGLLDRSLPKEEQQIVLDVLGTYHQKGIVFHALRSRVAGSRRFVSLHVLVPGSWTVQRGHDLCEAIEEELVRSLPQTHVFTHLEPLEDPVSWRDQVLK